MRLSTPTFMTVLVSLVLAVLSLLVRFGINIPLISGHAWTAMLLGYAVLLLGVLVRGL